MEVKKSTLPLAGGDGEVVDGTLGPRTAPCGAERHEAAQHVVVHARDVERFAHGLQASGRATGEEGDAVAVVDDTQPQLPAIGVGDIAHGFPLVPEVEGRGVGCDAGEGLLVVAEQQPCLAPVGGSNNL